MYQKPKISTGKKIDMVMDKIRVALFFKDQDVIKDNLEIAKKLVEDVSEATVVVATGWPHASMSGPAVPCCHVVAVGNQRDAPGTAGCSATSNR